MAEPTKTCGNCGFRDADGDCLALLDVALPMWLELSIDPVDGADDAAECETWSPAETETELDLEALYG